MMLAVNHRQDPDCCWMRVTFTNGPVTGKSRAENGLFFSAVLQRERKEPKNVGDHLFNLQKSVAKPVSCTEIPTQLFTDSAGQQQDT